MPSFFSGKFFCLGCTSQQVEEKPEVSKVRRASYSTSLRGNLVRTYKSPIEDDYYIDNEHELGKGGCGVVVVGEHKDTHTQYAIKIVNKTTAERGRLDRELKLLKDVDHANIVRLFSLYDVPGHMYFVMELCLGGHLGNLLSRQPAKCVDEDWARKLSSQLISAVAHIHSRGIAHRDIKLQNILIDVTNDRQAQLKLIDFGYGSRYIGALPMKTKCGTPYTTAPEVIRECYDERCDVWSMGVVIYIMLCGRRPFEALDIPGPLSDAGKASMITNILAGRYHFNHKAWTNVSKSGVNFVKMLLHPDYKTRIYSHEALEAAWLKEGSLHQAQFNMLKSSRSFKAVFNMRKNSEAGDLQRTGMLALVFGINSKAAADLRNVFQSFDADHSGMLSRMEFERAIHEISPDLHSSDINRLFDMIDIDKNKQISFSEFLAATLDPNEVDIEELSKAFKLLDEDGNGYITREELRKVLIFQYEQANTNNWTISNNAIRRNSRDLRNVGNLEALYQAVEDKINHIFEQVDVNNDGFISHGEFLCAMTGLDYYLDAEPFHREPGSDDDSSEGEGEEEEEEADPMAHPPKPTASQTAILQASQVCSNKYRDQDLQDLTNNEFEFVNEEDAVEVELKKASMNARQSSAKFGQSPGSGSPVRGGSQKGGASSPVKALSPKGGSPKTVGGGGVQSPTPKTTGVTGAKSPSPPQPAVAGAAVAGAVSSSGKSGQFVPIGGKPSEGKSSKNGTSPTPSGTDQRVTSLDRNSRKHSPPNATAGAGGIKPTTSDNDIKYSFPPNIGVPASASSDKLSPKTAGGALHGVQAVELKYAAAQKNGTPEASPRRGNLAFYDEQQNIKVSEVSSSQEEDIESPPAGLHKSPLGLVARASPARLAPIQREGSNRSIKSGGSGVEIRESPPQAAALSPPSKRPSNAGTGGAKVPTSRRPSDNSAVPRAGGIAAAASSAAIATEEEKSGEEPIDARSSFVKMGQVGKSLSYRNSSIIDNENAQIRVFEVAAPTGSPNYDGTAGTAKLDGDGEEMLDGDDADEHTKHTRRVSRANIKGAYQKQTTYEAVLDHIESPPPLLKAGSKAFSFSMKRADSGFSGINNDSGEQPKEPTKTTATPILGSLRKMISGNKLAV